MHLPANRVLPAAVAAAALALGAAAPAAGHGIVTIDDELLAFRATDFVSRNAITVTQTSDRISIVDSTGFGGLDPGDCRPGRVDLDSGYVIEAICPRSGIGALRVNVGEREDDVVVKSSLPTRIVGGGGIDTITSGTGDDSISGGAGDDVIDPGPGSDKVYGGDGDDAVRTADGLPDEIRCGDGRDGAESDPFDAFTGDCERAPIAALADGADESAPHPSVRNATRQRATGRLSVRATSDEPATFVAQAAVVIGEHDYSLRPGRGRLGDTVGAVDLRPRMSATVRRIVLRALRRHARVRLYVTVVATDDHGNSAIANARRITLVL